MQDLVKIHLFVLKILSGNEILKSIKGYNSVINLRKLVCNNTNLDRNPSICTKDIERKLNSDINQGPQLCYKFAKINV